MPPLSNKLTVPECSPITAALVGFGSVARNAHIPWYISNPCVQLVAVVEPTPRGRTLARSVLPNMPVFENLDSLLRSLNVTFVDITAPPLAHAKLILAAVEAGVDVFCEKPFVTNWQALQEIERVRQHSAPIIASCHNWYFAPPIRRCLEMIDSGLIGEAKFVQFDARRPCPAQGAHHWKPGWRELASEGGGVISDLGYHGVYLASRIFQTAPLSVIANVVIPNNETDRSEQFATLQLEYGEERRAQLNLSWVDPLRQTKLYVAGTQSNVVIDGDSVRVVSPNDEREERFESLTADSWHAAWTSESLDRFVETIRSRQGDGYWRDIQWCVSTLDAAYTSAKSGICEPIPNSLSATYLDTVPGF